MCIPSTTSIWADVKSEQYSCFFAHAGDCNWHISSGVLEDDSGRHAFKVDRTVLRDIGLGMTAQNPGGASALMSEVIAMKEKFPDFAVNCLCFNTLHISVL